MSYFRRILTDDLPVSIGTAATVTSGGDTSDSLDTRNYRDVEFFIRVDTKGSATSVSVTIEFSDEDSATSSDWAQLNSESISSGAATQSEYSADFDISSFGSTFTIAASVPVRGRYMRIIVTPDNTLTGVTYTAIRRI